MNATKTLLAKYRKVTGYENNAALGESLGVQRSAVANWVSGYAHPDAQSVEKMALAIGENPCAWLAAIEAQRARTPKDRQTWLRVAAASAAAGSAAMAGQVIMSLLGG